MIRTKGLRVELQNTEGNKDYHYLRVKYSKTYFGQILIKDMKKDVPKIIKTLREGLKEYKLNSKLKSKLNTKQKEN